MELTFENNAVEFEVTGDFNLHIERDERGDISVYQKTYELGEYALNTRFKDHDDNFDYDFQGLIYPKMIKVVSETKVNKAIVTQ